MICLMTLCLFFRSGTEEDFNELQQLLKDIYTFKRDQEEKRRKRNRKI